MTIIQKVFLWLGTKLFKCIDIYAPDGDVEAITFTNNEEYLKRIQEIEL